MRHRHSFSESGALIYRHSWGSSSGGFRIAPLGERPTESACLVEVCQCGEIRKYGKKRAIRVIGGFLVSTAFWALLASCWLLGSGCQGHGPTEPLEAKQANPCEVAPYSCSSSATGCYTIGTGNDTNYVCVYAGGSK